MAEGIECDFDWETCRRICTVRLLWWQLGVKGHVHITLTITHITVMTVWEVKVHIQISLIRAEGQSPDCSENVMGSKITFRLLWHQLGVKIYVQITLTTAWGYWFQSSSESSRLLLWTTASDPWVMEADASSTWSLCLMVSYVLLLRLLGGTPWSSKYR